MHAPQARALPLTPPWRPLTVTPTKVISVRNKDNPWFDDQCRHAFGLKQGAHLRWTRDRFRVNWGEFVRCQVRTNETYSKAKSHCLRLLIRVVDWCVSLLVKLICCRIILTASCPGRLLICDSLAIRLHLCLQGERGQASLVRLAPLWWHWPIGYVSSFS